MKESGPGRQMALYSLDNVPVHQNPSVRYERPVDNTFKVNRE